MQSPGFVSIASATPVFGTAAMEQARLHPRLSFNHFWSQLSLDSLPLKNKFFRHTADMAHAHLDNLTRSIKFGSGAILAVPSNYTRAQLGVLLGLVKQCAFEAVGLVDIALLQAASSSANDCIILDLQLHQAVLSRFVRADGMLLKDRVVQVPFAGLLALQDAWLNMVCEEFVRQSRFDPRQNAEAEQYVANQMSRWITQSLNGQEVSAEVNFKGSVHQAFLNQELFEQRAKPIYSRIAAELAGLAQVESVLHVATGQISLPGLMRFIPSLIALDDELLVSSCLQHVDSIRRAPDALQFITRLPVTTLTTDTAATALKKAPTHVLLQHRAVALPAGRLTVGIPATGAPPSARILPLDSGFGGTVSLLRNGRNVQLELQTAEPVLCNGVTASNGQVLVAGDRLQLGSSGTELQLIVVEQPE